MILDTFAQWKCETKRKHIWVFHMVHGAIAKQRSHFLSYKKKWLGYIPPHGLADQSSQVHQDWPEQSGESVIALANKMKDECRDGSE